MNADFETPLEPGGERLVDEALAEIKQFEPPLETRINNRVVVADELKALLVAGQPRPWWRRSISIPVPVAAGLAAAALIAFSLSLGGGREPAPSTATRPERRAVDPGNATPTPRAAVARARGFEPVRRNYANETYLCGLGRLRFESGNFCKETGR